MKSLKRMTKKELIEEIEDLRISNENNAKYKKYFNENAPKWFIIRLAFFAEDRVEMAKSYEYRDDEAVERFKEVFNELVDIAEKRGFKRDLPWDGERYNT